MTTVAFYSDQASGQLSLRSVETQIPYDFATTAPDGKAVLTNFSPGRHTIVAKAVKADGSTLTASATFRTPKHKGSGGSGTTTTTVAPTTTVIAPTTTTTTVAPTTTTTTTIATDPVSGGSNPLAGLSLIPWEGGPSYWSKFSNASGWTDPSFFPILIDNSFSSEGEVQADKSYGVTAYSGGYPDYVDYAWLRNNHMYWLDARPNNTFPAAGTSSPNWPGMFVADEPDGSHGSAQGDLDYVTNLLNSHPEGAGRFQEVNFTQIVAGDYDSRYAQMINEVNGPISADMYWYTTSNCGPGNPGYDNITYAPVDPAHCRTASSYGKFIKSIRAHDAGVRQPVWAYVEDLNGGPGEGPFYANITAGQLKGAVMDSIINEARGIIYFNTSLTGTCQASVALRQAEVNPNACNKTQADAMKAVDSQVLSLAPVINTQSYQYSFGPHLDTMLKWYRGSAYIFSMINGDAGSSAGSRTFTLPAGLASASSVQVVDENRTLPVTGGSFTDNFAHEYDYHIYKVTP